MKRYLSRILRTLVVAIVLPSPAAYSQGADKPVVFVHGLNSDGGWFSAMTPPLQEQLRIAGHTPTVGWRWTYGSQASNLNDFLNSAAIDSAIVVAHSNGGVVTRTYLTNPNTISRVSKILTVGSPLAGVPLAANALDGALSHWLWYTMQSFLTPYWYYSFDGQAPPLVGWLGNLLQTLGGIFNVVESAFGFLGYGTAQVYSATIGFSPDVLPEMRPNSPTLEPMFHPSALQLESQRAPIRYSIATEQGPTGMPFALIGMDPSAVEAIQVATYAVAWSLYDYYSSHPDYELQANAAYWQLAMLRISCMALDWQALIGTYWEFEWDSCSNFFYYANDGIVPWSSSSYPGGGTTQYLPYSAVGDIHHRAQKDSPAVREAVRLALRNNFGVLDR